MATEEEEAKTNQEAEEAEQKAEEEAAASEEEEDSQEVSSTMVASWSYDSGEEQISVIFVNGHEESYSCTPAQWEDAKLATSAGKYMHEQFL